MGDPEKRVKDLFGLVRQKSPCILLLDEADAIFWGGDPSSNKILAQVKAELSELRPEDRVVVIATSNKEQLIDQATRDRFEPNIFYIHPPLNDTEWIEVVAIHLRKMQPYLHPEVDAAKITKMFRRQRILSPRGVAETVSQALSGVTYGLYTSDRGSGGILTIQCNVRPANSGERHVSVTGQASSMIMGQTFVPDHSVIESAENAVEAVKSWLWSRTRVDLSKYHVHFQIRSILEGAPGAGVSGPSAGYAMLNALISELSNTPIIQSKVMTGTIGVKMDVGPVGGLGGRGREAGKLVGILKAEKVKITDLLVPDSNYRSAKDEMKMVQDEGIIVHPITNAQDGWPILFDLTSEELAKKIRVALVDRESLVDLESNSSRFLGTGQS